jgi:RND superfamily putative drug exporter
MARLAQWCFRHRLVTVLIWVLAVLGIFLAERAVGTAYSTDFSLPGTESTRALDLLGRALPGQAGESATIVWHVETGSVRDQHVRQPVSDALAMVSKAPAVVSVASAYDPGGAAKISPDGRTAFATVSFTGQGEELKNRDIQHVIDLAEGARRDDVQVELGGSPIQRVNQISTSVSELVGILAAAVVLLIAFGSILAMLLPLVTALLSLATGTLTIGLLSHILTMADIAPTIAALIGLGVGIDYALFIVTRHRNGLKAGMTPEASAIQSLNTSGRAVLFAGATVCMAMLGLLVLRLGFLTGIGISAAVMVLFTMLTAITLLPALLGFLGMRVLTRRERRCLAEQGPQEVHTQGVWARWSAFVRRHPRILTPAALVVLAVLIVPFFSLNLGTSDQGNDPSDTTTRKAYDLLAGGFGAGFNGPLQLVAEVPSPGDQQALAGLLETVRQTPGVAEVVPLPVRPGSNLAVVQVIPTTAPQDTKTNDLIDHLRDRVIPPAQRGHTLRVFVGGETAVFDDFAAVITSKLPLFIGVIVGLGFLLLLLAFRSLLIPLTAAVMNLAAAGAAFGVVVAFFQWGWGSELLGLGRPGPVEAFLPVMMLAILFGLSMDYQVFLVSRMHEEWVHSHDNGHSVNIGQAATGRVITAAATIMIAVFLAFVFGGQRTIAEFGLGLASAVFIDAFVLRTVLVPALMHLFGDANWWLPRWIDSWLPQLAVEPLDPDEAATSLPGAGR